MPNPPKNKHKQPKTNETPTTAEHLVVPNPVAYQATREALYKNSFEKVDGSPWPTALFDKSGAKGQAELRPLVADQRMMQPSEELDRWIALMWSQCEELSDLDADVLDALSALWLEQAKTPDSDAVTDLDDLLRLRGLQPKRSGTGREGGFRPHQRQAVLTALWHIQNLWLNITQVEVYDRGNKSTQAIQSRAFTITDRMGQLKLDGSMDVRRFIFRPGKVFAHFLFGPGRQTALLAAKTLMYDPSRQTWEKRLARYLSWQWRTSTRFEDDLQPYGTRTLLEAVGESLDPRRPSRTRNRLEKALNTLEEDKIIATWQYDQWDEGSTQRRGWVERWISATVFIELPKSLREHYFNILTPPLQPNKPPADEPLPFADRLKQHRKRLGLTQFQTSELLGITQGYLSQLERSKVNPGNISASLKSTIDQWLGVS